MKQKLTITLSIIFAATILFFACNKEELPKITSINKIELSITEDSTSYVFAQLKCDLNQNPKFEIEQYGFCWDTVTNVTIAKESNSFENLTNQSFTETIENLLPNKTYYVKAYIQNGDVIIYSNELTIQTLDARPIVTTTNISSITANSAQAGGEVEAYETLFPITQRGVCWAKTQNPTIADSLTSNGTGNGTFTSQLQNLEIGAIYFVRAYAINSEGISYGDEKNFTTLDGIPELTTDSIKNITATSATFYANIIENDGLEILEKGFCWSTTTNPTISNNSQIVSGNTLGSFNAEITGLAVNTTFYVKAYIKNESGTFYGDEIIFITEDGLPNGITTAEVTGITAISAVSGGNITDDDDFTITSRGVCWSTNPNPTISDNHTTDGTGTGIFTSNLTGLNVNTTYYVRAYATNANGTVYGEEYNFTTEDGLPTITTTAVSNITAISASSGGNITDDGGFAITSRGVCWSTSSSPTINDNKTVDESGTGSFTSEITGLSEWTTYYVRAYSVNSNGVSYGEEVNFKTINGGEVSTVTDYDGNTYNTIKIGNQWWMAENLKTTHYFDGTEIILMENEADWEFMGYTDKAMCYYNNSTVNRDIYGALYTWSAAMNGTASSVLNPSGVQGACPDGWHIPSEAEWIELIDYLGGESVAGAKLKVVGTDFWDSPNRDATNESGFYGLGAGTRSNSGTFAYMKVLAEFWSSTESTTASDRYSFYYRLHYNYADILKTGGYKDSGKSIRCIKD